MKDGLLDDRLGLDGAELKSEMGLIGAAFSMEQKHSVKKMITQTGEGATNLGSFIIILLPPPNKKS